MCFHEMCIIFQIKNSSLECQEKKCFFVTIKWLESDLLDEPFHDLTPARRTGDVEQRSARRVHRRSHGTASTDPSAGQHVEERVLAALGRRLAHHTHHPGQVALGPALETALRFQAVGILGAEHVRHFFSKFNSLTFFSFPSLPTQVINHTMHPMLFLDNVFLWLAGGSASPPVQDWGG